ncbi:PfkB family carbohydrate kinase [Marinicrinis sediminis]|uniref:PfkB family carbohydrate kinase n=1 Tax=Marinicrinis sediminis TaxID=1652465 RepID=A0ABW5R826_9BACL
MSQYVVTFGEMLIRLLPPGRLRFSQADSLDMFFGGAESNLAVSLGQWGLPVRYVTKLPDHWVGDGAIRYLQQYGVCTRHIARGGPRMGLYFMERGASTLRSPKVVYDRSGSSFAAARTDDFDWKEALADANWLHVTGITPAVGQLTSLQEAIKEAKRRHIPISLDLNYRAALWSREEADRVMRPLIPDADTIIGLDQDLIQGMGEQLLPNQPYAKRAEAIRRGLQQMEQRYGTGKVYLSTLRNPISAARNQLSGYSLQNGEIRESALYDFEIVDRVGAGDAFAAGYIYAKQQGMEPQPCIEFAVAAAAMKHSIEGDANQVSVNEIQDFMAGERYGVVKR